VYIAVTDQAADSGQFFQPETKKNNKKNICSVQRKSDLMMSKHSS